MVVCDSILEVYDTRLGESFSSRKEMTQVAELTCRPMYTESHLSSSRKLDLNPNLLDHSKLTTLQGAAGAFAGKTSVTMLYKKLRLTLTLRFETSRC